MMNKYIQVLVVCFAFFIPNVFAQTITGEIERIYPKADVVFFRLKGDECITGSQYYYFRMHETNSIGKYASRNWYSMLLATAMSGKKVSIKVNDCTPEGSVEIEYMYQDY